ncbi:E3 ubiquitin-protein ligase RNF168-like [Peromyscus californicus insignis]|uniref:E3 ubiquitin-protein ligase RNF168-like n=1 Tax=Peromyscus californicus insignis TaxID=564181 RepID=UPI0022A75DFE|nr:E3 ubiquitin-protein ligase RNF168-like [Peromyscus californicus insignis]
MALSKPDDLTLDDCQCLLCLEFLIEPITLPCNHTVCKSCFKALLRKTFLSCPFCRTWVSSWARYHTHINSLINKELWERIQAQYPEECSRRNPGEDKPCLVFYEDPPPVRVLSNPGELRKEYEEEMIRLKAERQATEEKQNRATKKYIRQLLAKDMEEEKIREEKRRLEEQKQREEEEAKKLSMGDTGTSPRKKKRKQKHCDNVSTFSLEVTQLELASRHDAVQDSKKTSVKTDSDGKNTTGQGRKTKTATVSRDPEIPNHGTVSSPHALCYGYDVKVGTSGNEAPKPSCSNHNFHVPPKNIKAEATAHSPAETESGSSVSGMTVEIGTGTTEAKAKMSHSSSSKHTSKRKHEKSSSEAADELGTYDLPSKSSSDEDEIQVLITKKLIDLENLYFEKHQQEEQDRLFALELQKAFDEEGKEMWGEKFPKNNPHHYDASHPDTSAKGEGSKDKDI